MTETRRWDIDERGHGIASAAVFVPGLDELRTAALLPDWVAEQPDAHLLPHLRAAIEAETSPFALDDVIEVDGILVLSLTHRAKDAQPYRDAIRLLASIAESSLHVHERQRDDGSIEIDVVTGMLEGQTEFAPHGHTLRLRIRRGNR